MVPGDVQLLSDLRRGTLEFCVLALLRDRERYALELTRDLAANQVLATSEGTLYPLLSRLRRQQWVSSVWKESATGPPRRYYRITEAGHDALVAFEGQWARFKTAVDAALKGAA